MKLYLEYISENETVFKRFRLQMIFGVVALSAFFIAYLYGKNPELYSINSGIVEHVEVGEIKVKPIGIKDFSDWKIKEAVKIRLNQKLFVFYGERYEDKKHVILDNIKEGDFVKVTHRKIDWNDRIYEIEKNSTLLLDRAKYDKKWSFLSILLPTLTVLLIIVYFWVNSMRKRFVNRRS